MSLKLTTSRKGKGKAKTSTAHDTISTIQQAQSPLFSNALSYRGPIWDTGAQENDAPIVTNVLFELDLSSDTTGTIASVFSNNPSGFYGWGNFNALYDEYRYLGIQVEYFPVNRYSKTTTTCVPGFAVVDRDDVAPLASQTAALMYESCRVMSLEDPWTDRREYRGSSVPALRMHMDGARESSWITTQTPAATGSIKLYFSQLSASTFYGKVIVRGLFQFRGRN
jgi:hypothetical protein